MVFLTSSGKGHFLVSIKKQGSKKCPIKNRRHAFSLSKSLFTDPETFLFSRRKESGAETYDPAIKAPSLRQALSLVNYPFMVKPFGAKPHQMFWGAEKGQTVFYDYQAGDLSLPDPDDHFESLEIDVDLPGLMARIKIAFNENAMHYQLDQAFIEAEGRHPKYFSCTTGDEGKLYPFLVIFSGVARKIINGREIAGSEKVMLRRWCDAAGPG